MYFPSPGAEHFRVGQGHLAALKLPIKDILNDLGGCGAKLTTLSAGGDFLLLPQTQRVMQRMDDTTSRPANSPD